MRIKIHVAHCRATLDEIFLLKFVIFFQPQNSEQENGARRKMPRATTLDRPIKRRAPPPPPVRGATATQRPQNTLEGSCLKPPLGSRPPAGSRPPWASRPPAGSRDSRPPAGSRPPLGSRPPSGRHIRRPTQPPPPPPVKVAYSRFGSQSNMMGSQSNMMGSQSNMMGSQSNMGSQYSGSQNFGSQNSFGYSVPILKRTLSMPLRRGTAKHPELQIPNRNDFSMKFYDEYDLNEYYV